MIKLERTSVMNFENALRGMRNPMNSWDKSDSYYSCEDCECQTRCAENCEYCDFAKTGRVYEIGPNDLELAQRLVKSGSDHRKFLRQIFVSVDVTAPLYWWKEYDTYKVGTVANSTSTMHKIHSKAFSRDDFSCERMSGDGLALLTEHVIPFLEDCRQWYNTEKNPDLKWIYWDDMIQTLPTSYNQMRTCTLNYENLINIYFARRHHKLPEWHEFCGWIEGLPYFKEICIEGRKNDCSQR